jgi:hypothetical protein
MYKVSREFKDRTNSSMVKGTVYISLSLVGPCLEVKKPSRKGRKSTPLGSIGLKGESTLLSYNQETLEEQKGTITWLGRRNSLQESHGKGTVYLYGLSWTLEARKPSRRGRKDNHQGESSVKVTVISSSGPCS